MSDDPVSAPFENYLHRALAAGAHYNDLLEIRRGLNGLEDWRDAWCRQAELTRQRAENALRAGRAVTGAADLVRVAMLYHFAQVFHFDDPAAKKSAHMQAVQCFAEAAPHLDPPLRRVMIPFGNTGLPGYLRLPANVERPPCVILLGGLDSTKEEHFAFTSACAERGLATLSFDGPGQGETFYSLKLAPARFVAAGVAVFDFAETLAEIDPQRLAIMGRSMGGHFAPRIAAAESRAKAVAVWGAMYHLRDHAMLPAQARAGFGHATGLTAPGDLEDFFAEMDLDGIAAAIDQPMMIVHSGRDIITPAIHATLLEDAAAGPVETLFFETCRHCAFEQAHIVIPRIADFLAENLGAA